VDVTLGIIIDSFSDIESSLGDIKELSLQENGVSDSKRAEKDKNNFFIVLFF
jgi:hypothetical protein